MKKRLIGGTIYVAVIVLAFILREFVHPKLFNLLIWAFCGVATFEMARAVKDKLFNTFYIQALIFGIVFVPLCFLLCYVKSVRFLSIAFIFVFVLEAFIVTIIKKKTLNDFLFNALPFFYPAVFIWVLFFLNRMDIPSYKGFIALITLFLTTSLSDVFAYLVGIIYSKIKNGEVKKLCPNLSPNKTVAGAVGGIIGGIIGAVIAYLIFVLAARRTFNFSPLWLLFIIVGLFGGILTEMGDLLESFIKRKIGIKDMGSLIPGHGGLLDRIDGLMVAGVYVFAIFYII